MIHILWATLRTNQFKNMHSEWLNNADNIDNIKTYVAVNWKEHSDMLEDYIDKSNILTLNTEKIGVCYPAYELSSRLLGEDSDIVVFASDDFKAPKGWDTYLINKLKDKGDISLMVRDGYQLPDSSNMQYPAITIPIMTFGCLIKLNKVIYHPAYNHMFSDCELYNNLKDSNMLYDDRLNDDTTFEHLHYAAGKRDPDIADHTYVSKWKEDEVTWSSRRLMNLEERLKV